MDRVFLAFSSQHALASTALPNRNWLTWSLVIYIVRACVFAIDMHTKREGKRFNCAISSANYFISFFGEEKNEQIRRGRRWCLVVVLHRRLSRANEFSHSPTMCLCAHTQITRRSCVQFHYFNLIAKLSVGSIKKQLLGQIFMRFYLFRTQLPSLAASRFDTISFFFSLFDLRATVRYYSFGFFFLLAISELWIRLVEFIYLFIFICASHVCRCPITVVSDCVFLFIGCNFSIFVAECSVFRTYVFRLSLVFFFLVVYLFKILSRFIVCISSDAYARACVRTQICTPVTHIMGQLVARENAQIHTGK